MAVIITNMDLPRGCFECPLREDHILEGDWCAVSEGCDLIGEKTRPEYCPLKSIDGLAEAIEQFPFTYGHASYINRAINEYCGKEHTDDN